MQIRHRLYPDSQSLFLFGIGGDGPSLPRSAASLSRSLDVGLVTQAQLSRLNPNTPVWISPKPAERLVVTGSTRSDMKCISGGEEGGEYIGGGVSGIEGGAEEEKRMSAEGMGGGEDEGEDVGGRVSGKEGESGERRYRKALRRRR
ncbi:hypothetical protein LINGRAHAP2_LOCUS19809 [Linum grandiflorum]